MAPKNAMRIEPKGREREKRGERTLNTVGHNFIEMKMLMS